MTQPATVTTELRKYRLACNLSQLALARQVGIARQTLCAIEAGTSVPGTDVALRLADVLGIRVENLFQLHAPRREVSVTLASGVGALPKSGAKSGATRVVLGEIDGRWIAHTMGSRDGLNQAADGLVCTRQSAKSQRLRVEPLGDLEQAQKRLLVMGCAPALGLLAARLAGEPSGTRLAWLQGSSTEALSALRRGEIHIAGIHLLDEPSGEYNVPVVRKQFPDKSMLLINLASWEQGIVLAPGNPLGIRAAVDLLRPKVRFIAREVGAGAHKLVQRALRAQGARPSDLKRLARTAAGHMEVAQAIALGVADAGIAIRGAALAYGLSFIPLAEERFDLVIPRALATDQRIERLVDTLGSRTFRRELDAAGGYSTQASGETYAPA